MLQGQAPYFNVQFDYQNRLETSLFGSVETDSFYILPIKGASPFQSVADTSFLLKINKSTSQIGYIKIAYFEGQSITSLAIKSDSNLVIQGNNYQGPKEYDNVDNNRYLAILDKHTLDTILLKEYGLHGRVDVFYRPIITSDGGIFSAGYSFPANPKGNASLLFFKCDSNLNQQFLKIFPPTVELNKNYLAGGVVETPDKGFLIVGTKHIVQGFFANALVVKVDSTGNQTFWKEVLHSGDTTELYLASIAKNGSTNYIAVGRRIFNPQVGPGWEQSWVVGLDEQGNLLWSRSYAENERSDWAFITPSHDGNFYASGYERDFADTDDYLQYATISKLAPNGDLIWHRKYSVEPTGRHLDIFFNVLATSDGGILCNGTTFGHDGSLQNAWVMKLDAWGCSSPGCQTGVGVEELPVGRNGWVALSPNPTSGKFRVVAVNEHRIEALRILSLDGRVLLDRRGLRDTAVEADLGDEPAGVYVVSALMDGVWQIRQVVKQ